jgi:hypothetical protein
MEECSFPSCRRPREDGCRNEMCSLHDAIWQADSDSCEAAAAAEELLPPMIRLAEVYGNPFLEKGLRELQVQAYDYSERRSLDYDMLHLEDRMDLD